MSGARKPAKTPRRAAARSPRSTRTVLFDSPWVRLVSKRLPLRPRAPREDYFVVETDDWAAICPRTADGRFVMVEQYRPALDRRLLEFPAGRIDPGETAAASIQRELAEEAGQRVVRLVTLGSYFADTGRLSNQAHLFFADVAPIPDWTPEPGLDAQSFAADEIDRMVADQRLGLHHVGLWQLVKAAGLVGRPASAPRVMPPR
jgi:8-oxo-dGTP pyrophosphatase MutT (NUDIX family)